MCGEPSAIGADDGHGVVVVKMERDGVDNGCAAGVAPAGDRDGMARHEVAWIETSSERSDNGVHRGSIDAVAEEDAAERIVAPDSHPLALVAEYHFRERDRTGKGERGAVRRVAAVRTPCRLDEAVLPCLDADSDRDTPALALQAEQEPHLASDSHAPQVRPLLDRFADSVGIHGAHAGPVQQEGQAVATTDPKGLQFRLSL